MRSKINYYSAKRLYENGIEQDGMLVCNKIVSDYSLIAVNDREDCHLFDQTRKALGTNIDLNKVFIILDFKDVSKVLVFEPFINGIKLVINGEEFYVDDVIPISASLLIMDDTDWKYVDYHELDVIVNNCSQFLKERLLLERS